MRPSSRLSVERRIRTRFPALVLGLWLLGMAGCAIDRQQLLERGAAQVAYRLPAELLVDAAREILKEQGYLILESRDPNYVRTSWKVTFDESLDIGGVRERHLILVKPLDDGRCVLNAYRVTYTTIGRTEPHPISQKNETTGRQMMTKGDPLSAAKPVVLRDLEMEWRILSRVSPSVAHELERQVDRYLAAGAR